MRYHTGITASRQTPPKVTVEHRPNPTAPAEVHIDFGGLSVWLNSTEARGLGINLRSAAEQIDCDKATP